MARRQKRPKSVKSAQDEVLALTGEDLPPDREERDSSPVYQVVGESSIRVSKYFGRNVERRKDAAIHAMELTRSAWDEAYRYYNHNQVKGDVFRTQGARNTFRSGDSYENLVFSNTSTMIPAIYAKNPDVTFSTNQDEDKEFVRVLSIAVNALFNKKAPFGINLKPRMKKAALHAELTNFGVVKLDFITKNDSIESAQAEMEKLYDQMENAKDINETKEIEGKMQALEASMEWMEPGGFRLKNVIPVNLIVDPAADNEDGSDAMWMIEECYIATDFLNARYTKKDGDDRKIIYKPTHKIQTSGQGSREDALGLVLEAIEQGPQDNKSYTDEERMSYLYQNMTKCWFYWDRSTRRVYLFLDSDWTWPVWVWEDDLKIGRFFPYFFVQFYPATFGIASPGEVSYYLDQQDEINDINAEWRRIRRIIFNVLVYNKNKISIDDAKKIVDYLKSGTGDNVLGIDIPEGQSIKDAMETLAPPSINYEMVFNKQPTYTAIDRLSSVSEALRGAQFKTNTVQDAVEAYQSAAKLRVSNRTDAIETCVEDLSWAIAEILIQWAPREYIQGLIGDAEIQHWKPFDISKFRTTISCKVAAGSTEKPTSAFRKDSAIKLAQAIGQFARGAPASALRIVLKLLQASFPELDITKEDWESITQETMALMQRGVSTGAEGTGAPSGTGQGQGQPNQRPNQQQNGIEQQLNALPTQEKAKILQQIEQGVPPQEALAPYLRRQ